MEHVHTVKDADSIMGGYESVDGLLVLIIAVLVFLGCTMVALNLNNGSARSSEHTPASKPSHAVANRVSTIKDKPLHKYVVVVDAGHGGYDDGAQAGSGSSEKGYTLAVAKAVYSKLKEYPVFEPYLSRTGDTFVDLSDRAKFANELKADALISIHANYYKDPRVRGTETFYYADNSLQLAKLVQEQLVSTMAFGDRGIRKRKLKVLSHSIMPASLVEIGYLTNKKDEAAMLTNSGENRTALAIVAALKSYFAIDDRQGE